MSLLTLTQKKVLDFILEQINLSGTPPTLREISRYFNWNAVGSAQDVVTSLRRKGCLQPSIKGKARHVIPTLTETFVKAPDSRMGLGAFFSKDFLRVPLLGLVHAGYAQDIPEQIIERYSVFPSLGVSPHARFYALEVEGLSMQGAGFFPKDTLLVESSQNAKTGDIVVAQFENQDVTVKRYALRGTRLYEKALLFFESEIKDFCPPAILLPENPDFPPLAFGVSENDRIVGVVKSLYRGVV